MRSIFIAFLMTFAAPISAQDFQKGYEAYQNGDYATALKQWKPLAEGGDSVAQTNLGMMYTKAEGVPQDYKEAARLYRLAAEQGHAKAENNLGVMYRNGEGVLVDYITAHIWFNIAAVHGLELFAENRERIAIKMTSEDLSKAQATARVCMSSNYEKCGY